MALTDYKFCEKGEVEVVPNGTGFSVTIDGKIACSTSSGGAHRFRTALQAEAFGRHLVRGYTVGSFLSSDVENFLSGRRG